MKPETPTERANRLMGEVRDSSQGHYTKGEVISVLHNIWQVDEDSVSYGVVEIANIRRGDVFVHKMVGGKRRPWIALSCRQGIVTAVAMSSGDSAPRMVKSQCRLWEGRWIGTTVSLIHEDEARLAVLRPYTNLKHLREIENHLARLAGLRPIRKVKRRRKAPVIALATRRAT